MTLENPQAWWPNTLVQIERVALGVLLAIWVALGSSSPIGWIVVTVVCVWTAWQLWRLVRWMRTGRHELRETTRRSALFELTMCAVVGAVFLIRGQLNAVEVMLIGVLILLCATDYWRSLSESPRQAVLN